jgi:hypothetical protein
MFAKLENLNVLNVPFVIYVNIKVKIFKIIVKAA